MGAMTSETAALPVALAELKAFLRISIGDEDALLAGFIRAAADHCEAFIGRALIDRLVEEIVAVSTSRIALGAGPVRAVTGVASLDAAGQATDLPDEDFSTGIDAYGEGWIRLLGGVEADWLRISYRIGMAADWNGVPEMLRHGIVRLAAQYYSDRERAGKVPAAVTALWRPWRRLRLR